MISVERIAPRTGAGEETAGSAALGAAGESLEVSFMAGLFEERAIQPQGTAREHRRKGARSGALREWRARHGWGSAGSGRSLEMHLSAASEALEQAPSAVIPRSHGTTG
jgi:hypothetical protein